MQPTNNTPLVPTRFVWPHGGRHVHLCGSFTRWRESLPMAAVEGHSGVFAVVCALTPGYHQYKFIVDSEWRHDDRQAYMPDPLGNVNNWLLVRPPDPSPTSPEPNPNINPNLPRTPHQQQQGFSDSPHAAISTLSPMPSMAAQIAPQVSPQMAPQIAAQAAAVAAAAAAHVAAMSGSMEVDPVEVLPPNPVGMGVQKGMGMGGGGRGGGGEGTPGGLLSGSVGGVRPLPMLVLPGEAGEGVSLADAEASRQRVADFLSSHVAAELLPESGKVVALDIALPVKQAFHALYEQGVPAAPLWDSERCDFVGMLSASDFITIIQQVRNHGGSLSEAELESHTIAAWKEAKQSLARPTDQPHTPARRPLIHVGPDDSLRHVAEVLLRHGVASVPVLHHAPPPGSPPQLLHLASLSGILKCVARHFRHVAGSLPLLAHPLSSLPLGTWAPNSGRPITAVPGGGVGRRQLATLRPSAPITAALAMLLAGGRRGGGGRVRGGEGEG